MRSFIIAGAPASPKYPNRLGTNASLLVGGILSSPNGRGHLELQHDGNLVFTDTKTNKVLWASGTAGQPVAKLEMVWNGNLRLVDSKGKQLWGVGDRKQKDCFLEVQDDGNAVVYHGKRDAHTAVWSTGTFLWKQGSLVGKEGATYHNPGFSISVAELASVAIGLPPGAFTALKAVSPAAGKWGENAVKTAGAEAHSALHAISKATADLSLAASKVKFIGPLLSGLIDVGLGGPWHVSDDIASGVRLDKAIGRELERQLKDFKEIGPYAQMVFSLVPGFGPFVAGAIGAGLALANGQPIDQVLIAGIAGMAPGGPLVTMAVKVGAQAVRMATSPGGFRNFTDIGKLADGVVNALPIPAVAQDICRGAINICAQLASGARIDQALLDGAAAAIPMDQVPAELRNAILAAKDTIKALAKGKRVDKALIENGLNALPIDSLSLPPEATNALHAVVGFGQKLANGEPIEHAALESAIKALPIQRLPSAAQAAISHVAEISKDIVDGKKAAQIIADAGMSIIKDKQLMSKDLFNGLMSGCALGHGSGLQDVMQKAVDAGNMVANVAKTAVKTIKVSPIADAAIKALAPALKQGAMVGLGLMTHQGVGIASLGMIRQKLTGDQRKGFDMGVSLHVGLVTMPKAPDNVPPIQAAGTVITTGMLGATDGQITGMMATIAQHPEMKKGAAVALSNVAVAKEGLWAWILRILTGGPHPVTTAAK